MQFWHHLSYSLKSYSGIWSVCVCVYFIIIILFFFKKKTWLMPDHTTNIRTTFIWSITTLVAICMPDTVMPVNSSYYSFSSCFDVCQSIQCLQVPLFWQADPPNGLVLYSVTSRSAIIWAGVRSIFFLFMIMLWSCRAEITADLCLDATPRELACISMSPMKRYIWILWDLLSGTFVLISIENLL